MSNTANPKYTNGMPGRDWDILNMQIQTSLIPEMEKDTVAMVRYLADNSKKTDESWLFKQAGGVAGLFEESSRAQSDRFCTKMKSSGSWILGVAGRLVPLVQAEILKITMKALGGDASKLGKTMAQILEESEIRTAETPLENEFVDVLIYALPKFFEMSPEGMEKFKSAPAKKEPKSDSQPAVKGNTAMDVLNALQAGLKNMVPAEVQAIRNKKAGNIYPEKALNANLDASQFQKRKSNYESRKRKEEKEYETVTASVRDAQVAEARQKQEASAKAKKTTKTIIIIAVIIAAAFLVLKLLASIPLLYAFIGSAVIGIICGVVAGVYSWNDGGGCGCVIAFFIAYVVVAVVLILLVTVIHSVFNGVPFVEVLESISSATQ